VFDFEDRDALYYVIYDLEPLMQAALAARARGENWFDAKAESGASLAAALEWLRPYVVGEKQHEEFAHSHVAFDSQRAAAGEKGFSGPFDPKSAARLYWIAAEFAPQYGALAEHLNPRAPAFVVLCGELDIGRCSEIRQPSQRSFRLDQTVADEREFAAVRRP
jgi:hypothetical protein